MNKSLIEVQAGYDEPEDDLTWLARNVESIDPTHNFICRTENDAGYFTALMPEFKAQWFNARDYIKRRAELQNKPSWGSHSWPNIFQNENGHWFGVMDGWDFEEHISNEFKGPQVNMLRDHGEFLRHGKIIGDWRNTFEKRPEPQCNSEDVSFVAMKKESDHDPLSDLTVSIKPTTYRPSMSELYPRYYKDVSRLTEVDVYAIHDLFAIDDPSGCIQHASKKLLLCGVRTGGKPAAQEIKEARDTLTRKLQLMGVE